MKIFLETILPKILPDDLVFEVFDLGSKSQFLKKFPKRLAGYSLWMPDDYRVVLVVDADRDDCSELRAMMITEIEKSGLTVTSLGSSCQGQVLLCIAIEMLEAWFFGDARAIGEAYGKKFMNLHNRRGCRQPDRIQDPARRLESILTNVPKHQAGLKKVDLVLDATPHMDIENNTSNSFCRLRDGVRFLINSSQESHAPSN